MAFTFVTLGQAETDLGARLYDAGHQFWPTAELDVYLQEALRTWNALTSLWRSTFTFGLSSGVTWYDLTTASGSPRPLTVTDQLLVNQIEYHLLEPQTSSYPLTWTGSSQFSVSDLLGAIQRRRDETLSVTGCQIIRTTVSASTVSQTTTLSDSVIDIRRVVWIPGVGASVYLSPMDVMEKADFDYTYLTVGSGIPEVWMASTQPPLTFDVDYIPTISGNYEILTVNAGPALSASSATVLGIPDDWAFVVKWGALSDLLNRESNPKDALRAAYAEKRYREGLMLLQEAPGLLMAWIGTNPLFVDAVKNGDNFNTNWQALGSGIPEDIYAAGLNLIAMSPAPNSNGFSLTVSVVQNAPFTSSGYLQVTREDYDAILDYAQHLAAFKMGGIDFTATIPLYQRFLKQASIYNSKLAQLGIFQKEIYESSQREAERAPILDSKVMSNG